MHTAPAHPSGAPPADAAVPDAEAASIVPPLLSRVRDAPELHAGLLALLVPVGSRRPAQAWQTETAGIPAAGALRDEVQGLARSARLPWFERLLVRMAGQSRAEQQRLLESSRRIMGARGAALPIDTLHWLVMRHRFGERGTLAERVAADTSFSQLPDEDVHAIARYTAFLARLVPVSKVLGHGDAAWYVRVLKPWAGHARIPPLDPPPDSDELVHALRRLQAMPWMQRPLLARLWVSAAVQRSPQGRLADDSADALRMSCQLLDSPMPPELAAHYVHPQLQ